MQQPSQGLTDDQYNEQIRQIEEENRQQQAALDAMEPAGQQQPEPATAATQPQKSQATSAQETTVTEPAAEPQEPEKEEKEKPKYSGFMYSQGHSENLWEDVGGSYGKQILPRMAAPGAGIADFGQGLLDKITPFKIPQLPKFEDEAAQSIREISSVVLPALYFKNTMTSAGTGLHARIGHQLGNDRLVKFISLLGIDTASGVAADYFAPVSAEDDNLAAILKKSWPQTFGWVPESWATLSSDDPEEKRRKTVVEGAYLGLTLGMMEGLAKFAGAKFGSYGQYGWVPENERGDALLKAEAAEGTENIVPVMQMTPSEQAKNWYNQKIIKDAESKGIDPSQLRDWDDLDGEAQEKYVDLLRENGLIESVHDTPEDIAGAHILRNQMKRDKGLDDLGDVAAQADPNPANPQLGNHDVFTHREQGIVTPDNMGVYGAQADAAKYIKTGRTRRLGSVFTEAAKREGLDLSTTQLRKIYKKAAEQLRRIDGIAYKGEDGMLTSKEISDAGEALAADWLKPGMSAEQLRDELDKFKTQTYDGVAYINEEAYDATIKATKGYFRQYLEMDELKASAIINNSMAGEVSDLAESSRLMEGTEAVARAREMILDRLEYLMAEKGVASYIAGRALNMKKRWKRLRTDSQLRSAVQNGEVEMSELIKQKYGDAKQTLETLRGINKERPEFLGPMMLAYELSDGRIHTMTELNKIMRNNMGTVSKAFFDGNPEIPSLINNALMGAYYNSLLTSISTPAKAGLGNLVLMATKPLNIFLGGAIRFDKKTLQRGWIQYSAFGESLSRGFEHMGKVFSMASKDPNSVGYIMRDDLVKQNKEQLLLNKAYAESAAEAGNEGPLALVTMLEEMMDFADHPWLRFGANAMTAFDGFTRAMIGSSEARIRAYDRLIDQGVDITEDALKSATEVEYQKLFDPNTKMITDDAVDYASREISLSLDNRGVDALNNLIKHMPLIKPFILFPRTATNALGLFNQSMPISAFAKDVNDLAFRPTSSFSKIEIQEILEKKGIKYEGDVLAKFRTLKAEIRGRKAMGMLSVLGASYLFMNDRLRGNGHYKKEVQKVRRETDWAPRTYKGWDGKWYSYDGLGPISDWLALTADVMDNFDTLETATFEKLEYKMAYVLGASVTNKSWLASLEPMMDVLSGNPAAMNRTFATQISGLLPLSGVRRELGQIMYPGLREVKDDLMSQLRNRNPWLDGPDPDGALPRRFSWVEGDKVGYSENWLTRITNATLPFKQYDEPSPREQFLQDIEFDQRPIMNKSENGFPYTEQMKAELYERMGNDPVWQRELDAGMRTAEYQNWVETLRKARRKGLQSEPTLENASEFMDKSKYLALYTRMETALREAKNRAEQQASFRDRVNAWEANVIRTETQARGGTLPLPYR